MLDFINIDSTLGFILNNFSVSWSRPLYILSHSKTILKEAILRDASFLEKSDVMDYSLLVGLNSDDKLLVLGIIGKFVSLYTFIVILDPNRDGV